MNNKQSTPNQETSNEKEKPWYRKYAFTLSTISLFIFLFAFPYFSMSKINTFPELKNLKEYKVKIIGTRKKEPHLIIEMPDKSIEKWYWPIDLGYRTKARYAVESDVWNHTQRKQLVGCTANIRGVPIQWEFIDKFRVWELSCPDKNIFISLDKTFASYQKALKESERSFYSVFLPFYIVLSLIMFFLECYLLKKEKKEKLKEQETKSS